MASLTNSTSDGLLTCCKSDKLRASSKKNTNLKTKNYTKNVDGHLILIKPNISKNSDFFI